MRTGIDRCHARSIFLFTELFVPEAVRFLSEPDAEKARVAPDAIAKKGARVTILTVLTSLEIVAAVAVDAVVEEFRVQVVETINTGFILLEAVAVVAVLTKIRMHDEIAVLAGTGVVDVIGVDERPLDVERERRHFPTQSIQLFKERLRKIERSTIGMRIPSIAMPAVPTVDRLLEWRRML